MTAATVTTAISLVQEVQGLGFSLKVDLKAHSSKRYTLVKGEEIIAQFGSKAKVQEWVEEEKVEQAARKIAAKIPQKNIDRLVWAGQLALEVERDGIKSVISNTGLSRVYIDRSVRAYKLYQASEIVRTWYNNGLIGWSAILSACQNKLEVDDAVTLIVPRSKFVKAVLATKHEEATQYVNEVEGQDGVAYWKNFETLKDALCDFDLYVAAGSTDS